MFSLQLVDSIHGTTGERETSTLKVDVSELKLQLLASLVSTHNGSFLWCIPEVARDAIDERITSIYSPLFYTGW